MNHLTRSVLAICLLAAATTLKANDDPAKELGIKPGISYAKVRSKLLAGGWKADRERAAIGSDPGAAYKQYPEIICGNGYDAMCIGRFIRADGALLLTIDQSKKTLPVMFIESD